MTTRNAWGLYTANYPQHILDLVRESFERGERYSITAAKVRSLGYPNFNKNNVAGMVSRLREKGLIKAPMRNGVARPDKLRRGDKAKVTPITLPPIPQRRTT